MAKKNRRLEEFWNVVTHGIGVVLSVIALILLVRSSLVQGSPLAVWACAVYGVSLIALYSASTLYHASTRLSAKKFWRRMDHLSIYLLIAGTYTPVVLLGLQGVWGWSLFAVIWGLVLVGFLFKFSSLRHHETLSLSLYALMGWLCVVAVKPMLELLPSGALIFIALGGLFYTVGIYFYHYDQRPYYHAVWHVLVLLGSGMHFFAVYGFLLN